MKISVVIPAFNEEKYIATCLESLAKQTEKPYEIIVVDNNSTDKTAQIAKSFGVKVVTEKVQGRTPARNKGFNIAKGDIIGRIDADTQLPPNWVKKVKARFQNDPELIALSGPAQYIDNRFNRLFRFPEKFMLSSFKKLIGVDCLYGPNMILRKSSWQKVKKYTCPDDKIVHEDFDIAIHLAQLNLGKVIFDKTLVVSVSERRWKNMSPYLEYPYRYLRTIQHHKRSLHKLSTGTNMVKNMMPKPKRMIKRIRSSALLQKLQAM